MASSAVAREEGRLVRECLHRARKQAHTAHLSPSHPRRPAAYLIARGGHEAPASCTRSGAGRRRWLCQKRPQAPAPEASASPAATATTTATTTATSRAKATGMTTETAAEAAMATAKATEPMTRAFGQGGAGHADRIVTLPPPPDRL